MGLIIILVAVALIWYFGYYKKKQTSNAGSTSAPLEVNTDPVVEEALTVVNDFLNIGRDALLLTDSSTDFRGFILIATDARPPFSGKTTNYGFYIRLCNLSDLAIGARKNPKMLENNPKLADNYYAFINKYQNCYDASERGYVYKTQRTVPLLKGQEKQLHSKLEQQIAARCPLADFSGELLYTKNVARD